MTARAPGALKILATLAVQGAMDGIAGRYAAAGGGELALAFAPTQGLLSRIDAGEAADLAILTEQAVDDLLARGVFRAGSRRDVAVSTVGVAVRAGAPRPEIGTVAAFVAALRAARSITYSRIGASGLHFAALIERLGIAAEVNAKATVIPSGFTAALAADGRAELAIQQVSELLAVPGIEVVGPLPPEIGSRTLFSAAVFQASDQPERAAGFAAFLAGPDAAPLLRRSGLDPIG